MARHRATRHAPGFHFSAAFRAAGVGSPAGLTQDPPPVRADRPRSRDRVLARVLEVDARDQFPPGMRAHPVRFWWWTGLICAGAMAGFALAQANAVPEPAFSGVAEALPVSAAIPALRCWTPVEELVERPKGKVRAAGTKRGQR